MSDPKSMPTASEVDRLDAAAMAYARANLARLLAIAFAEPDEATLALLGREEVRRAVVEAVELLRLAADPADALRPVSGTFADLRAEHARLFGHTVRSLCPPYELEYGRSEIFQQAHILADLSGFYAAMGLTIGGPVAERCDHCVAEWEFLALCGLRYADALCAGHAEAADVLADMQRKFLADHAAAWMPAFLARVQRNDSGVYANIAALAKALLEHWCAVLGARVGPDWLELRPVSDEDAHIECGAPDLAGGGNVELGPWLAEAVAQEAGS